MYGGTGFLEKKEIIRSGNIPEPGRWMNGITQSRAGNVRTDRNFPGKPDFDCMKNAQVLVWG